MKLASDFFHWEHTVCISSIRGCVVPGKLGVIEQNEICDRNKTKGDTGCGTNKTRSEANWICDRNKTRGDRAKRDM